MNSAVVADKAHAKLSASGAHRWMTCPASISMEEDYPDSSSEFAREGTAAHEVADWCLRKDRNANQYIGTDLAVDGQVFTVDIEMADYVQEYVNYVLSIKGFMFPEQRVDFSAWVPDGFGTADAIVIDDGTINVIDLKYGRGVRVEADNNPQLMLYALGALQAYDFIYDLHTVRLTVVQPRIDHISEWEISVDDLLAFGATVKTKAQQALGESPEFNPSESACRFCKAKGDCRPLAEHNFSVIKQDFTNLDRVAESSDLAPERISNDQLATIIGELDGIKTWVSAIEQSAIEKLKTGETINGYKLVEGRSNRRWLDEQDAEQALRRTKLRVADIFTKKLISPTQAEKKLGKTHRILGELVIKPQGKPTLARADDKRPALNLNPTDGFEVINQ